MCEWVADRYKPGSPLRNSRQEEAVSDLVKEVLLAGAISSAVIEPTPRHLRQAPALRIELRRRREPLDLDAEVFQYRICVDGSIQPMREVAVRFCRCGRH
jgi:hypothetical protein